MADLLPALIVGGYSFVGTLAVLIAARDARQAVQALEDERRAAEAER